MGYYLLLIVPLIPFAISLFLGGVAWAWKRYVGRRFIGHLSLDIMCDTDGKVEAYFLSCLKQSIPFLGCVYSPSPNFLLDIRRSTATQMLCLRKQ